MLLKLRMELRVDGWLSTVELKHRFGIVEFLRDLRCYVEDNYP